MLIVFHKLLMVLAAICLIAGVGAAVFFRRNHNWLKFHKLFNTIASLFLSVGIIMAITAVCQQSGNHLDGLHPVTGSIAWSITIISLILGFYQFKAKKRMPVFKTIHRWSGRISVVLVIAALITGLVHTGII